MWMPELSHFQMCVACMHIDPLPIASIGVNVCDWGCGEALGKDLLVPIIIT